MLLFPLCPCHGVLSIRLVAKFLLGTGLQTSALVQEPGTGSPRDPLTYSRFVAVFILSVGSALDVTDDVCVEV